MDDIEMAKEMFSVKEKSKGLKIFELGYQVGLMKEQE